MAIPLVTWSRVLFKWVKRPRFSASQSNFDVIIERRIMTSKIPYCVEDWWALTHFDTWTLDRVLTKHRSKPCLFQASVLVPTWPQLAAAAAAGLQHQLDSTQAELIRLVFEPDTFCSLSNNLFYFRRQQSLSGMADNPYNAYNYKPKR